MRAVADKVRKGAQRAKRGFKVLPRILPMIVFATADLSLSTPYSVESQTHSPCEHVEAHCNSASAVRSAASCRPDRWDIRRNVIGLLLQLESFSTLQCACDAAPFHPVSISPRSGSRFTARQRRPLLLHITSCRKIHAATSVLSQCLTSLPRYQ